MGGGRYDGLVEEMGGPPTPAVGWAAGIERLAMLLDDPPRAPAAVAVVPIGDSAEAAALDVLQTLRHAGIRAEMAYRGNLRRRMERANRIGARAAVIIGEDDIARGVAQVKNLATGEQEAVALAGDRRASAMNLALEARPHRRARRRVARHADAGPVRRSLCQGVEGAVRYRAGGGAHRRSARRRTRAGRCRGAARRSGDARAGGSRTARPEGAHPGAAARDPHRAAAEGRGR